MKGDFITALERKSSKFLPHSLQCTNSMKGELLLLYCKLAMGLLRRIMLYSRTVWFSPSTTKSIFYIYWLTFSITYLDFINWFRTWFYYMSVYRLNQLAETCLTCGEWMFSLHDVFVRVKLFLLQISVRTAWLLSQLFTAEICQTWLS